MIEKKLTVCIIDDSEVDVFVTKKVLQKIPEVEHIIVFNDAENALAYVVENQKNGKALPDVFLLDIMMPNMSGFEWIDELDEILEDDFEPAIFLLSGTDMKKDFESFNKQRLSSAMLLKPLQREEFIQNIAERKERKDFKIPVSQPKHL